MKLVQSGRYEAAERPSLAEIHRPKRGLFHRIFGRHLLNAALLVCAAAAFAGPMSNGDELVKDPDLWWHLANARLLCTTHHFIRVDSYSFTVQGERWTNPEWLSEVPYWFGYLLHGLTGVHLVALIAFCANLLFVYFRCNSKSSHAGAAFWVALLSFFMMAINGGARTIVIAYLAMNVEMVILESVETGKTGRLWLLPILFCVWINLHGSWIIGLGLLALYILSGLFTLKIGAFEQTAFSAADRNRLILVFFISVAALMVNPYGWRLIWNPFDMLLNQKLMLAIMEEWQPLNMGTTTGKAAALFVGLMIVANCLRGRKWRLYELAFTFFAWYVAFAHQRFVFLACLITAPWLAADLARGFFAIPSNKTIPALNALFVAGAVCTLIYLFPSETKLQRDLNATYPFQSIARIQPSWRTFNDYSLGGMMDFNGKPTFVDSRDDIFEHQGILKKYLDIEALHDSLSLLGKSRIDHVLIHENSSLSFVLERSSDWRTEMREGSGENEYKLFVRVNWTGAGLNSNGDAPVPDRP
jgi:hypothetical protein